MAYACGDYFPQVEPRDALPDGLDPSWLDGGLTFCVPEEFHGPDEVHELGVPGNQFELVGYYHYVEEDGRRFLHPRFDLYAWRPVVPYGVWRFGINDDGGLPLIETIDAYPDELGGWRRAEKQPKDPHAYDYARKYDYPCF